MKNVQSTYQNSYKLISKANNLKPKEPQFYIQLAQSAAKMAVLTQDQQYTDIAIKYSDLAVSTSPANINFKKRS